MLDQDIEINGVSINKLLNDREAITQEASKIISDNIEKATKLVQILLQAEEDGVVDPLAKEAFTALDIASSVSAASGVHYYIPFSDDYGGNDAISDMLEDTGNEILRAAWNTSDYLRKLLGLAYDMEADSKLWNSSNC